MTSRLNWLKTNAKEGKNAQNWANPPRQHGCDPETRAPREAGHRIFLAIVFDFPGNWMLIQARDAVEGLLKFAELVQVEAKEHPKTIRRPLAFLNQA